MCGIFGYIGPRKAVDTVLDGLKKLEYRGYDSAGIGGVKNGQLLLCKEVGKIAVLEQEAKAANLDLELAIAHTRWATHGVPSKRNAHPQTDTDNTLAVVHNGIIENHEVLRQSLLKKGISFTSETDTEVIAHLVNSFYKGDLLQAVKQTVALLEGSYALAIIHRDFPDRIVAVSNHMSMVVGIGHQEAFLSSDSQAFAHFTKEVIYLTDGEIAVISAAKVEVFDAALEQVVKEREQLKFGVEEISKNGYEHFTLKEIHQQPQVIRNAIASRTLEDYGTVIFEELNFGVNQLMSVERILMLACGTSYHAGYIGAYMLEDKARIPSQVQIASEFRYKNPIVPPGTLVIAISQSGETADTIAAVREVKAKGAKVLSICNVPSSKLVRESDTSLFLRAGPEIGVCSTKAFTSQVVVLGLLTVLLARMRHMNKSEGQEFLHALQKLPEQVQQVLDNAPHIAAIAKKYASYDNFFFMGRQYMFPTSLEGALKLKEISYINANGYAAGEIKHGPIALLNAQCPVVALCANKMTLGKLLSNLTEVKARHAPIIAIAEESANKIQGVDEVIWVPDTIDELAAIPTAVATQLLAYYCALERGADIDQPRNLAKSVTVE